MQFCDMKSGRMKPLSKAVTCRVTLQYACPTHSPERGKGPPKPPKPPVQEHRETRENGGSRERRENGAREENGQNGEAHWDRGIVEEVSALALRSYWPGAGSEVVTRGPGSTAHIKAGFVLCVRREIPAYKDLAAWKGHGENYVKIICRCAP